MSTLLITPSPYASRLQAEMTFQLAVTAILHATTRPKERDPRRPTFTRAEMDEMPRVMDMGVSPAAYAAILMKRDRDAARSAQ